MSFKTPTVYFSFALSFQKSRKMKEAGECMRQLQITHIFTPWCFPLVKNLQCEEAELPF